MCRVIVERETNRTFLSGGIEIFIDGKSYGKLPANNRVDVFLPQGNHTVAVRMGRKLGSPVHFTAAERETITFRCCDEGGWAKRGRLEEVRRIHSKDRF